MDNPDTVWRMSWQATIWAANLPHSRVGHVPFRVLMLLADHAHDDGKASWRSVSSLASTLDVSERTIHRAIAELRDQVLIREGDQRLVNHIPSNKRPKVYDLVMAPADSVPLQLSTGVTDLSGVTTGVAALEEEPPLPTSKTYRGDHTGPVTPCPGGLNGYTQHERGKAGKCIHCHQSWETIA